MEDLSWWVLAPSCVSTLKVPRRYIHPGARRSKTHNEDDPCFLLLEEHVPLSHSSKMSTERSVVPLESNPEVFTSFAHNLGLDETHEFADIYSLTDPDLLAFVPRPVKALILLFPLNEVFEAEKGLKTSEKSESIPGDQSQLIWFKQTIRNACGLYGLLHSLASNKELLKSDSVLLKFLESNPRNSGQYADDIADDFVVSISEQNEKSFQQGQTQAPEDGEVDFHFITFVSHNGKVYELDGRRPEGAKLLGDVLDKESDLVAQKAVVDRVQWYMDNADEESKLNFSLLGLVEPWK